MNIKNRIELQLENFDKCNIICDSDCPLGMLFDYSCALQSFVLEKMNEQEKAKQAQQKHEQSKEG